MKTTNQPRLFREATLVVLSAGAVLASGLHVQAQDQQVWAQFPRLTVPSGASGTQTNLIYITLTNTSTPVNLAVDVGNLPAGVSSASLTGPNNFTDGGAGSTTNASMVLTVNYTGAVPQTGTNELAILATGGYEYRLPIPVHSAKIWAGSTNNNPWSTAGNWSGSGVPSSSDVVVFTSAGAAPAFNDDDESDAYFTNSVTNVVISSDQTVNGLRFTHGDRVGGTPDGDASYRVEIKPGVTLSVTGTEGFSLLQDTINLAGDIGVDFFGGGSLLVSNPAANVALLKEVNEESILNLSGLDTFTADVARIGLGEYQIYPYYTTNGYSVRGGTATNSRPARYIPRVSLALTNRLRATHVDANDYTNATVREYALSVVNNQDQGGSSSDAQRFWFLLGRTNTFLMDSIVVGASVGKGDSDTRGMRFNSDTNVIPTNMVPAVLFRAADGVSRMSIFAVGDNSGPGPSGNSSKGLADFSGGRVDALVDRLYLGRDRLECDDNDVGQGELTISDGVFDVNTAYISMQEQGNNALPLEDQEGDDTGEVLGTLNVSTSAVFRVSGTLHLGYTTADPLDIRFSSAVGDNTGNGQINVSRGGVVMASNIFVGGVTKASVNNRISISTGGQLIVTNEIAQSDKYLARLSMSDGTLTLHVDGSKGTPYVYADQVITGGAGNTIKIASLDNVVAFPSQIPLIAYNSASPNFAVEFVTPNRYGYVVNNTMNNTIDMVVLDTPPVARVWNGSPGTDWNTNSPNWKNSEVFVNGDTATFDDTATTPTVNVAGTVFLGGSGVLVTNNSKAYTMSGAGTIAGTAPMNKWGTNSLTINTTSELPLTINEGSVAGSGAVGATTVKSNTSLTFSGAINRLTTSGNSVLSSGAQVANGATINGGSLTNSGRITNTLDVTDSQVTILAGGFVITDNPATSQIRTTNTTLTLNGVWSNGIVASPLRNGTYRIDVGGTMNGTGRIGTGLANTTHGSGTAPAYWSRLVIGSGGVFSPGVTPGQMFVFTNQSQLDFSDGSRIVIDVDMDSANGSNPKGNAATGSTTAKNSDVIFSSRWSTRTGTIRLNRLGVTPWTNGTVLKIFGKPSEQAGGAFRNRVFDGVEAQKPIIDPPSPGLGLLWNLEAGPDGGGIATNGIIAIVGTASTPTNLTTTIFQGTNVTFSWPESHKGWELLTQTRALTNGLSTARSNWTVVANSTTTNMITITNWINDDAGAVFYRLAHPQFE